jgi:hypothetical protein
MYKYVLVLENFLNLIPLTDASLCLARFMGRNNDEPKDMCASRLVYKPGGSSLAVSIFQRSL